jgi:hypothetical protein
MEKIIANNFFYHRNDSSFIYQIVGIAKTDDVGKHKKYNRKAHFFARGFDHIEDYYGFIYSSENIIMSLNRSERIIDDRYVLFRPVISEQYNHIQVMKKENFIERLQQDYILL